MGNDNMITKTSQLSRFSGGERSYINVALTLALNQEFSSPLIMMDEYDVFTDP